MPGAVRLIAAAVLLIAPTVLAFYSGGYFDGPRFVAALVAWSLVLVAAVVSPRPLPRSWPGRLALAGLALVTVWTGLSISWAPLSDPATDALVRLLLYLGAFVAAAALLGERSASRAVEPVLALGVFVVIGYGLAGRLVPDLFDLSESSKAFGRLEQPITYWNAEGALAAFGFVLCARLAAAADRQAALRSAAAAVAPALGLGVYLSYSRGAIAAALVGLFVLLAASPTRPQLRSAVVALAGGALASACAAAFPAVASLDGSADERTTQGALMLAILVAVTAVAALLQARFCRSERSEPAPARRLAGARRLPAVAALAAAIGLAVLVAGALAERGPEQEDVGRGPSRLASVESRRYDYWRVGLDAWAGEPLRGLGAGAFRVEWLRSRPVDEGALEIHSLPIEMLVELGLPGLLGFVLFVGGVAVAGVRAHRAGALVAPGLSAAATVFLIHASIDWDWQLPAVTLPALLAAGGLVAAGEAEQAASPDRADSAS